MAEPKSNPKTTASPSTDSAADDLGAAEVKQKFDEAQEQGFFGVEVDETPNEAYSLQGGPAGEGTPEAKRMAGDAEKGK